jgi:putative redox protein
MNDVDGGGWVISRVGPSGYRTEVSARSHSLVADEPLTLRGTDAGPTPYEYLLIALGSCTAMTLRMYADRKGWPLERAEVSVRQARSHEPDCENCVTEPVGVGRIERRIELFGALSDEQRRRLLEIAERCPVKQTLQRGMQVVSAAE